MSGRHRLFKAFLYPILLLLVFVCLLQFTQMPHTTLRPSGGFIDLSGQALSQELIEIKAEEWEYYPGHLYTPADFSQGSVTAPLYGNNKSQAEYGTYRLKVKLPDRQQIYAITGSRFPFSQRVFIDGKLAGEVGIPGSTKEETTPHSGTYRYYFQPEAESAELVFQVADFHHRDGGRNKAVYLAHPAVVDRFRSLETIRTNIIIGTFSTIFLYLLGLFLFFPKRRHFLYLGGACAVLAIRMLFIDEKYIMTIFPLLDWAFSMQVEYLCHILFVVLLQLYFYALYPGMLPKWLLYAVLGASFVFAGIVLFGGPLVSSYALLGYTPVWVTSAAVTLWQLLRRLKTGGLRTLLICIGLFVFAACAIFDEIMYYFVLHARMFDTMIAGLLVCAFMNLLVLTLDFSEIEHSLAQRELELADSRTAIMLSQIQPHFLFNSLLSIQDLCARDAGQAEIAIMDFSKYLRGNLNSLENKRPIAFEAELQHVRTYLALEQRRFEERLQVEFDIQATDFSIPALTLQPIVENAIQHGIMKRVEGGRVLIRTQEDPDAWRISVYDDGIGFDPTQPGDGKGGSIGIKNVRHRLHAMCGGTLHIEGAPDKGTAAIITIPKGGAFDAHNRGG